MKKGWAWHILEKKEWPCHVSWFICLCFMLRFWRQLDNLYGFYILLDIDLTLVACHIGADNWISPCIEIISILFFIFRSARH